MVKVKSSQKIFTDSEVASLTGICVDHLHNFARSRHLGFIARAAEAAGAQADQWLFTLSDLMVLTTLFPRCTHTAARPPRKNRYIYSPTLQPGGGLPASQESCSGVCPSAILN